MPSLPDRRSFLPLLVMQVSATLGIFTAVMLWPAEWNAQRWVGAAIAVPAEILLLAARFQLGRSFSISPQARELVTRGVYAKIRNPMYVFSGLLVLAFLLTVQNPYLYAILVVLVPAQIIRARREARVLEEKFGDQYRKYREGTWF